MRMRQNGHNTMHRLIIIFYNSHTHRVTKIENYTFIIHPGRKMTVDAIKALFQQQRILYSDLKNVCGIVTTRLREKTFLVGLAEKIAYNDFPTGYVPSEEDIIREYGIIIIPEGARNQPMDYTIDRRIALVIAVESAHPKGEEEKKKHDNLVIVLNKAARAMWLPQQTSAQQNSLSIGTAETKNQPNSEIALPGQKSPDEPGIPGSSFNSYPGTKSDDLSENSSDLVSNSSKSFDHIQDTKTSDGIYFPEESRITKTCKSISNYLIDCIRNNIDELKSDHLININDMITATGLSTKQAQLDQWFNCASSKEYIRAVMRSTKKPYDEVYKTVRGRHAGTWANIYIAFDIARWIYPDFGIMVYSIVMDVMSGRLDLIPKIADQHDRLHGTVSNIISIAPASADQVRQTTVVSAAVDTMSPEQLGAQYEINTKQSEFNHGLMRAIDYSKPVPKGELYYRDPESGTLVLSKTSVNKTNVERALVTLYPEIFYGDNITTLHDLVEEMWFKIVYLENSLARAGPVQQTESQTHEDIIAEQKTMIRQLRIHIEHLTTIHRLKPLIDSLQRPRPKRGSSGYEDRDEPNIGVIYDLLNDVFSGARIRQNTIDTLNWQMTSKLGCEFKTHVDFRNLVAVVSDMTDIFRADLTTREFNPVVPREFGNLYHLLDQETQSSWSPMYYHSILADVTRIDDDHYDDAYSESESTHASSCDTTDKSIASDPSDPYAMVSLHIPKSKKSSVSRSRVVKRAIDLGPELRSAILKVMEDRANSIQPVVMKSRDDQVLNLYYGQDGYAFRLIPVCVHGVPKVTLAVSLGDILEAGAFHLRPAGQITLTAGTTSVMALTKLSKSGIPMSVNIGVAIFAITRDYISAGKSPIVHMIKSIVTCIGAKFITSVAYPTDPLGQSWNIVAPWEL